MKQIVWTKWLSSTEGPYRDGLDRHGNLVRSEWASAQLLNDLYDWGRRYLLSRQTVARMEREGTVARGATIPGAMAARELEELLDGGQGG